jgi:hypothetical protein
MKRTLIFLALIFVFISFSYAQVYSVKNRWNTKLSLSYNRTNDLGRFFNRYNFVNFRPRLNIRAECNYGVLKWLELGGYIGYMRYQNPFYQNLKAAFAPTFGINVNIHLLPFLVKKENCRWELYLTAKYGGTYLTHYTPMEFSVTNSWRTDSGTLETSYFYADANYNHYRHEFGVGVGGGVYFKNIVGLYAEVLGGQFSHFPEMFECYYTARLGIELKFISKKRKENNNTILM